MDVANILQQLNDTIIPSDRLIGADWLEERGYVQEAGFYRWLVQIGNQPFSLADNYHIVQLNDIQTDYTMYMTVQCFPSREDALRFLRDFYDDAQIKQSAPKAGWESG